MLGAGLGVDLTHQRRDAKPQRVDIGDYRLAGLKAVEPAIFLGHQVQAVDLGLAGGSPCRDLARAGNTISIGRAIAAHLRAGVHQTVAGQSVALGHLIVVEIMRAGDLHRPRTKGRIRIFIGNDRDQAITKRQMHHLADNRLIARIRRMHRNRAIAQHGLGPGGGNRDIIALLAQDHRAVFVFLNVFIGLTIREPVFEMPHMTGHFDILDLKI